jgi:serine/threonine-protein kinase RsbW
MEITLRLALPREAHSVPVVRRILKHALQAIRIQDPIIGDLELALTEACTNVLDHAAGTEEYEVTAGIKGSSCVIEVVDRGVGFDAGEPTLPPDGSEDGRGLMLMKAVSDSVSVVRRPASGMTVRIEKHLEQPEGPLHR